MTREPGAKIDTSTRAYNSRLRITVRYGTLQSLDDDDVTVVSSQSLIDWWWWWLQHPSKDDEACAISGKRTTNSKLNTSIIGGCGVGVRIVDFFSNIRA